MTEQSSAVTEPTRTREGDQVLPSDGLQDVGPEVIKDVDATGLYSERVRTAVILDLHRRIELGTQRYGHPLQTFNNRNAIQDLYEERLDAAHYSKQVMMENRLLGLQMTPYDRMYRDAIRDILELREILLGEPRAIPGAEAMRSALASTPDN
jgi:hypothetical protein